MLIETEDGARLEVPDGSTPEQLDEVLRHFSASSKGEAAFDKRTGKVEATIDRLQSGQIGASQAGFQVLGQGLGAINDKIVEAIPQTVKDAASYGLRTIVDSNPLARANSMALGQVAPVVAAKYDDFAKNNPNGAANLDAAGNLAGVASLFVPGPRAVNLATDAARVAPGASVRALSSGVEKLATPRQIRPNAAQLEEMGVKAYEAARASGEMFDAPSVSNKFVAALDAAKPKKIAGAVETDLSQALESGLGKYRELLNKPLGIDEIDIIDKDLSNLKDQAYNAGKNQLGGELSNIQNALRGAVTESTSGQTLAQARDLFRRKFQMEDVERIFRNAEGRPNEAAIIQTGYRNLANQARKKGSGYTKEQIALMDKASKGGLSIDALKFASSKLIAAVAAGVGGPAAGATAYMGNIAAGAGATALQTVKANRLVESITSGIAVPAEPTMLNRAAQKLLTPQQLGKLSPAEARVYLQEQKLLPYYPPEREIIVGSKGARVADDIDTQINAAQRAQAEQMGLTPDVRRAQATRAESEAYAQKAKQESDAKLLQELIARQQSGGLGTLGNQLIQALLKGKK